MNNENESIRCEVNLSVAELIEIANIGSMYLRQGNLEKAKLIFEGLVELDSELFEAHSCLGAFYTQIREDTKALYHLNKAISLNPNTIAPYVNRAEIHIREQKIEDVITDILEAIKLDKNTSSPDANRARTMLVGIYDAFKTKGWITKKQTSHKDE
jgi:tetratricopeptide (TPR) repeat protein